MIEIILAIVWALGWFWMAYDWHLDNTRDSQGSNLWLVIPVSMLWPLLVVFGMFILSLQAYDRLR